jgi:uncharacterized protein
MHSMFMFMFVFLFTICDCTIYPSNNVLTVHIMNNNIIGVKNILNENQYLNKLSYEMPPLVVAGNRGRYQIASLLLDYGFNVDEEDKYGFSPLKTAARNGHFNLVKLFMEHNADIHYITKTSPSPLSVVAAQGNVEMGKYLIEQGVIDTRGTGTVFPIQEAARKGHLEFVKLLINKKYNVNIKDNKGWTALLYAVINKDYDMVVLLLDNGANPLILAEGANTLNYACRIDLNTYDEKICKTLNYFIGLHIFIESYNDIFFKNTNNIEKDKLNEYNEYMENNPTEFKKIIEYTYNNLETKMMGSKLYDEIYDQWDNIIYSGLMKYYNDINVYKSDMATIFGLSECFTKNNEVCKRLEHKSFNLDDISFTVINRLISTIKDN